MTARRACLVLLATLLLLGRTARAEARPDVMLRAAAGDLPLELTRAGSEFAGELRLENRGATPVEVRVRPRAGSELTPRLPPTVSATFADGKTETRLAPGQAQAITLRWAPGRERRPRALYGQIEVELDGGLVVAGFHAQASPVFGGRPLSVLLALPLLGLAALGLLARRPRPERLWLVVAGVGAAQIALAITVLAAFVPALNRYDGNDGYQFIERSVLSRELGIEYALGVDGFSLGSIALAAFAIMAAALLGSPWRSRLASYWAFVLLIDLGVIGALAAIDLALVLGFWWLGLLGAAALVAGAAGRDARPAATRFALFAALAFTLVLVACLSVAGSAGPAYLVDGTEARRAFSFFELSRVELSGWKLAAPYIAVVLALGALMGLAPLNAWLSETTARLSAAVALLVNLATVSVAGYLLLRLGYGVLPRGTIWAAPALGALGALSVLWGGFTSARHDDLRRLAASAAAIDAGIAFLSFSALTAIGIAGHLLAIQSHMLSMVLWFGLAASLERRGGTTLARLRGALSGVQWLLLGAPGTLAFVAQLLAIFGAFPLNAAAVAVTTFGLIGCAFFQLRRWSASSRPPVAEPALPLDLRERVLLFGSASAIVLAGVWPAPLLTVVAETALDHAVRVNPPGPLEIVEQQGTERPGEYLLARSR
jgi:NADH:ubiquinone oxidoreductase subunit 4 (subunit M)